MQTGFSDLDTKVLVLFKYDKPLRQGIITQPLQSKSEGTPMEAEMA